MTEDPNIATLRETIEFSPMTSVRYVRARDALNALASTLAERDLDIEQRSADQIRLRDELAERDRRIAELELRIKNQASVIEYERGVPARPAPAPGELGKALEDADRYVRETNAGYAEEISAEAVAQLALAARSWQRLQWQPALSPKEERAMVAYEDDNGVTHIWGYLAVDALPALNGEDI